MKTDPCFQNLTSVSIAVIWLVVTMKVDSTGNGKWSSFFGMVVVETVLSLQEENLTLEIPTC